MCVRESQGEHTGRKENKREVKHDAVRRTIAEKNIMSIQFN